MTEWWQSLRLDQQIFYTIAILATLVLVLQVALSLLGADHDVDADFDLDAAHHHGSGLRVFSVQALAAFFAGFGWVGVLWLNHGFGLLLAIVGGAVVGGAFMAAIVFLMRFMMRMHDSGTLDYRNAVGVRGTVYCPIPPHRGTGGQIEVMIQGRLVNADAVTEAAAAIATGAHVRVVALAGLSTLLVEPE